MPASALPPPSPLFHKPLNSGQGPRFASSSSTALGRQSCDECALWKQRNQAQNQPWMESSPSCLFPEQRGRPHVFLALRKMTPVSIAQAGAFIERTALTAGAQTGRE